MLDAVTVGRGPAGLSAALVLGRARKRVLVLDTGRPANAASAAAIGGLLSHDGITPGELRRKGREQLTEFPTVEVRDGMDTALRSAGVQIRQDPIRELIGHEGRLDRIEFLNGPAERREALFVRTDREQPNGLAEALGCDLGDGGTMETDVDGRTAIPGIYVAGDAATDHSRSVANAVGTGSRAAYAVALDLVTAA